VISGEQVILARAEGCSGGLRCSAGINGFRLGSSFPADSSINKPERPCRESCRRTGQIWRELMLDCKHCLNAAKLKESDLKEVKAHRLRYRGLSSAASRLKHRLYTSPTKPAQIESKCFKVARD